MSTIMVPIDLAHESSWKTTLPMGIEQARSQGARLLVMTVVPDIIAGLDWRYAIRGEQKGSEDFDMKKIVADALARLKQIISGYDTSGITVEALARHGTVYEEILEVTEEQNVDQIIIGAHRPSLANYLLGPNTARVVRHANCSVNVVRT